MTLEAAIDRRAFVGILTGGAISACLPGCAALAVTTVRTEGGQVRLPLAEYPQLSRQGGSLRVRTETTGELYYVIRREEDRFVALSPICTHQGCTVEIAGQVLECPCHGSMYDLEGEVLRGPAEAPLRRVPARLVDETVLSIQTGPAR